jgi:hypothetical protein
MKQYLMIVYVMCYNTLLQTSYKYSCRTKQLKMSHPGRAIANFGEVGKRKREDEKEESNKKEKKDESRQMDFFGLGGHPDSKDSKLTYEDVVRLEDIQKKTVAEYFEYYIKKNLQANNLEYYSNKNLFNYETLSYRLTMIKKTDVLDDAMKSNITILRTDYYIESTDLMLMIGREFEPDDYEFWTVDILPGLKSRDSRP